MRNLAPIGVSTYSRINHLKQTIEALQKNTLAKESNLYIFSDAPKAGDEEKIAKIRNYIHTIDGFKSVNIIERKTNSRVKNNRGGIKQLLDEYGRIIFMEDDIVTAPGFLQFMNDGLDFYKDDKRVLSIAGYCPPIKMPNNYNEDIFLLQRFSAWGFATWEEKFNPFSFELEKHGINKFLNNKISVKEFKKNGEDMYPMLISEKEGKLDALDVKLMFYEFKYDMFSLYPQRTLTQNIGLDGSGVHCGATNKFHHKKLWDKTDNFQFVKNIQIDAGIIKANYKFRKIGLRNKTIVFTKKIGIFPLLKSIKEKIKK